MRGTPEGGRLEFAAEELDQATTRWVREDGEDNVVAFVAAVTFARIEYGLIMGQPVF